MLHVSGFVCPDGAVVVLLCVNLCHCHRDRHRRVSVRLHQGPGYVEQLPAGGEGKGGEVKARCCTIYKMACRLCVTLCRCAALWFYTC